MRRDKILLGAALRRSCAQKWQVSIYAAERILATGYSPEGMDILAIFARLEAMSKRSKPVLPTSMGCP